MKKTTNIILDFDGTLGDTASVIIQTMQATIKELNLPARSDEECAAMIGLRLIEIPAVLFPECGDMGNCMQKHTEGCSTHSIRMEPSHFILMFWRHWSN